MVNSTNNNQEEQRPVLTVTPREIDLGAIKPGEIAFGEYSLKNIAPGELKWSISCPDDWESVADKTLKGTASNEPTYLRLELAITESNGNVSGEKARIATYRTSMKMEAAGKELICQKNLKAGTLPKGNHYDFNRRSKNYFFGFPNSRVAGDSLHQLESTASGFGRAAAG